MTCACQGLAQKIRAARKDKGLSQRDLAALLDVSQQTVAHWEQGGMPRGNRLIQVESELGISMFASCRPVSETPEIPASAGVNMATLSETPKIPATAGSEREWQDLTRDQVEELFWQWSGCARIGLYEFREAVRAVSEKLKEGNT